MKLKKELIMKKISVPLRIFLFERIDSTNNEAKRRAADASELRLYAATHQTAGRGRHGRSFYSPKDTGLYMTLSFPLPEPCAGVQKITCAAAVAVCAAVRELSGQKPLIKWVNDVYIDGKKVAGILTELVTDSSNQPCAVIVGIGLNLSTKRFPAEISDRAGNIGDIDVNALCGSIAENLISLYPHLNDSSIIEKYREWSLCIGQTVTYVQDDTVHTAKAVDVDKDGGLIVEENGMRKTLFSGEISVTPVQ